MFNSKTLPRFDKGEINAFYNEANKLLDMGDTASI